MGSNRKNSYRKSRVKIPYLGKISLFWCDQCNLPLLDNHKCDICKNEGRKVSISPPGDVRPAFWKDFVLLQQTVNIQFGEDVGTILFSENNIVLLNRIGGLDRTDEVIVNGKVIGLFLFNPVLQIFEFRPKIFGGQMIFSIQKNRNIHDKKQIWLNNEALPYILTGKSILAPGVDKISDDISNNDYVLIIAEKWNNEIQSNCIAIGISRGDSNELNKMLELQYGSLSKNKEYVREKNLGNERMYPPYSFNFSSNAINFTRKISHEKHLFMKAIKIQLKRVYTANILYIKKRINQSTKFIRKTIENIKKPVAVAYSGGKDSLCTLLLVWKVLGPNFKIFFADTGLELPEVLQNVQEIAQILNMSENLLIKKANNTFWEIVDSFGPPGRDYRYCCHSLKAQQITELINTIYNGEKVLSFLGQRQYESITRAQSKLVYVNSFIPLQIAATPIKTWNALILWLFILFEPVFLPNSTKAIEIPITPLYFDGHERLGCYLCPASNLSSFKLLKSTHPQMHKRWFSYLEAYAKRYGLPKEWVNIGLWRFKRLTPQWQILIESLKIPISFSHSDPLTPLNLSITKGFSPCLQSGYSIKGRYSKPIDLTHFVSLLPAMTKNFVYNEDLNIVTINSTYKKKNYKLNYFSDGTFFLLTPNEDFNYNGLFKVFTTTVLRSIYCSQCKTCISICPTNAITLTDTSINIISEKCTSCGNCISHCPLFQMSKKLIMDLNKLKG
jgi:phosphoadenosine phosphosulfate reductase